MSFAIEVDARGDGNWHEWKTVRVPAEAMSPSCWPAARCPMAARESQSGMHGDGVSSPVDSAAPSAASGRSFPASRRGRPAARGRGDCCAPPASRARCSFWRGPSTPPAPGDQVYYEINERLEFARVDARTRSPSWRGRRTRGGLRGRRGLGARRDAAGAVAAAAQPRQLFRSGHARRARGRLGTLSRHYRRDVLRDSSPGDQDSTDFLRDQTDCFAWRADRRLCNLARAAGDCRHAA